MNLTLSGPREDALGREVESWQGEVMNQGGMKCPEMVSVTPDPQTKVEESLGTHPSLPEGFIPNPSEELSEVVCSLTDIYWAPTMCQTLS